MGNWDTTLSFLKGHISDDVFNVWFKTIECKRVTSEHVELVVPSEHHINFIENQFVGLIEEAIVETMGRPLRVKLRAYGSLPFDDDYTSEHDVVPLSDLSNNEGGLNPDYTFDAFVVGPSNQFAYAAAVAVAERPAENYNPLFIYGGVGLGKTPLMHAIGHEVQTHTNKRVTYLSSEQFTNELIVSIERKEMSDFRERYRTQCDVLLIDDIQFIAGKERTQEEFFHTFNALHNNLKQIVLTSDKTPQEIPKLEERLQSRFIWGLVADIQRPEMETRVAILKKKAASQGFYLPDDVAMYLANNVNTNIRDLEGSLKRLAARAKVDGKSVDIDLARADLQPFLKQRAAQLNPERILKLVSNYCNVKLTELKGKGRTKQVAYARQLAMFLGRKHTGLSYTALGKAFGKDHTTVISAVRKIEDLLQNDPATRGDMEALERNLLA